MKFSCPECHGVLNPANGVVLLGERGRSRGLFVFDPTPGHYVYAVDSSLEIEPGEIWEFRCPICRTNLTTHYSDKLAHLRMEDDGAEFIVIFSKIASEHATFVLTHENIEIYGEHLEEYLTLSVERRYW